MSLKNSSVKDVYDLFRFNNLRVVYCPNDALGLDGPFKEVDEEEIVNILNGDFKCGKIEYEHDGADVMISGV